MNRILLSGKNGQVGWELHRTLATLGEVIAPDRIEMDLANPDSIRRVVREHQPTLIVNAAAYTAVDMAEDERELAMAVNGVAPGIMAEEAKRLGAAIIHYSTDYVFDGRKETPYTEDDPPNPLNVYGATKLAGERAIQAVGVPHIIFRTSWVYSERGKNFLLTMLRLVLERDVIQVVGDQIGAPTWARMIAEVTAQCLASAVAAPEASWIRPGCDGIYHLTASGKASWCDFAQMILDNINVTTTLTTIASSDYPTRAERPLNSCLSHARRVRDFGLTMPSWRSQLMLCLDGMRGSHHRIS